MLQRVDVLELLDFIFPSTGGIQIGVNLRLQKIFVAVSKPKLPINEIEGVCQQKWRGSVAAATSYERISYFYNILPENVTEVYAGLRDAKDTGFFFTNDGASKRE
jgi:hypothetical protein